MTYQIKTMEQQLFESIDKLSITQIWMTLNPDNKKSYMNSTAKMIEIGEEERHNIISGFMKMLQISFDAVETEYQTFNLSSDIPNHILFYQVCIYDWCITIGDIIHKLSHCININCIEEYTAQHMDENEGDISISPENVSTLHKTFEKIIEEPIRTYIPFCTSGFRTYGMYKNCMGNVFITSNYMTDEFDECHKIC